MLILKRIFMKLLTLMQTGIDSTLIQNGKYKNSFLEKAADFFMTPARWLWVGKRLTLIEKKEQPVELLEETRDTGTKCFGQALKECSQMHLAGLLINLILIVGYATLT